MDALVQSGLVRVGGGPLGEGLVPLGVGLQTALGDLAGVGQGLLVDREVDVRIEAQGLLEAADGVDAESGAVRGRIVGLARGRPCDEGVDLDELRTIGDLLGLLEYLGQALDVLLVGAIGLDEADLIGVPAVGLVTLEDVLGEGDLGLTLDLDVVGVEDHGQVAELLVAGERAGLGGDAFLDVAFAADDPHLVVERRGALGGVRIEQAALIALAVGEADGGGQTLAQRAGGHLDARGQADLGMARGTGVLAAAEVLDVVQGHAVAGEVQLHVLGQRGMAAGEDEAITAGPLRVVRIVLDEALIKGVGDRSQRHRGTGMAVTGLLNGVRREHLRHLDGALVQFRPRVIGHRFYFPSNTSNATPSACAGP